ncbi:MAG: tetratricopeptide repeat protein [Nitrospinales bacterium]
MSLKPVFVFLLFILIAVYLAFLNPNDVHFQITQSHSIELPFVVFLLGAILAGVILTSLLNWTVEIRRSFRQKRSQHLHKREAKERRKLDELYEQGENALAGGRLERAESIFQKVLRQDPGHVGALHRLGLLKKKSGNRDQAIDLHNRAVERAPDNLPVMLSLAEDYLESGQEEKGMNVLRKIQEAHPDSPVPLYKIRDLHRRKENWDQAIAVQQDILTRLDDARKRDEERGRLGEFLYNKGLKLYQAGQPDAAISELKRSIRESNRSLPAYVTLGDIYFEKNKVRKALKTWKTGFEKTRSPVCLQRIRQAHQQAEKPDKIVDLYQEAIRTAENSEKSALVLTLGAILLDQGKPEEAIDTLKSISSDASLVHNILLSQSYQAGNCSAEAEKTSRSAFDAARQSLFSYACRACHAPLKEWKGHCPECGAWDSAVSQAADVSPVNSH